MNALNNKRLLLSIIFTIVTGNAMAQTVPPLERVVTMEFSHEKIEDALLRIAKETKVVFSYSPSTFDSKREINESFKSKTIREILEKIFKGSVSYKEKGKYIILTKAPSASIKSSTTIIPLFIYGYILNGETGEKLAEVSIYDKKSLTAAVTNQYGYFKLEIEKPENENSIAISKRNFIDTTFSVTQNKAGFYTLMLRPEQFTKQIVPLQTYDTVSASTDSTTVTVDSLKQITEITDEANIASDSTYESISEGKANVKNIQDTLYRPVQASLLPFIGTNGILSGNVINSFSFNLIGGYSRGTKQLEIGGVFNIDRGDVSKLQVAGVFNMNGGRATGLQAAGLFNANKRGLTGLQTAGFANLNTGRSKGAQVAGFANIQTGKMSGAQVAGFINVSTRKMKGVQVSAFVNYARNLKGAQVAFLNIADTLQGAPIGFFSYVKRGYHKLEFSADEIFYTNIAFRTGTHKFYNILTFSVKPIADEIDSQTEWAFGYGFGTAPRLTRWLFLNFDLTSSQMSKGKFTDAINLLNRAYAGFEIQPARKFSLAFGITLNGHLTKVSYEDYADIFNEEYRPKIIKDHNYNNGTNLKMWWGAKVGIRFF